MWHELPAATRKYINLIERKQEPFDPDPMSETPELEGVS